jgi:hypothetical protein
MKISTTWTQEDWNKALKKVWELSRDFEEILNFGLEHGYITNSDIIHASDIYKDPNKEYDDSEIEDFIKSVPLSDLMKAIQDEYSLDEILFELPNHEILENFDKSDLLEELDGSWELDQHDEEIREETYKEYVDEWVEDMKVQDKEYIENLYNANSDDFHTFICDILGSGYYDQSVVNKLKEKLKNNSFGVNYEK